MRHLLRIPEQYEIAPEEEDEFACLNLEITCPPLGEREGSLPILVWIHGKLALTFFFFFFDLSLYSMYRVC